MPAVEVYRPSSQLVLGTRLKSRVPDADQVRQRREVEDILSRLARQPGVILADEVGMGKTFVALGVAYSVASQSPRGPVIVMVPANLISKWEQDLKTFCELYLENRRPVARETATSTELRDRATVRYGTARDSVTLLKLLDDPPGERCHLIFLAQGAMGRRQTDKWVRLALIAETLRRHARGGADRLIQVKSQIHRFLAELLWAIGEERAHDWGDELWQRLLRTAPESWKDTYNAAVRRDDRRLSDDPVPKAITRALPRLDLKPLSEALQEMPVRARGTDRRLSERIDKARKALRRVEEDLWRPLLADARWRSPLLVMDEAHHLKNPATLLARQLQSPDSERDLRTGDGALASAFDRMLFLTATPFQLGHHELVRVLERFADVCWDEDALGEEDCFRQQMSELGSRLNDSQRAGIALRRAWSRLRPEDLNGTDSVDVWWSRLSTCAREILTPHQRALVEAYDLAKRCRVAAEDALRPWVVRHNKGVHWVGTEVARRSRIDGAGLAGLDGTNGLPIPPEQLLPFFLAARSAIKPGQDLLGEALCSSYEAFRYTRQNRDAAKDVLDEPGEITPDLSHAGWYLAEFDRALERCSGSAHPKMDATVRRVVDLWATGEKVLVFAFYRHTCAALRVHISQAVERRIMQAAERRLLDAGHDARPETIERLLERVQKQYFDESKSRARRAVDAELTDLLRPHQKALDAALLDDEQRETLIDIMRRFLRVRTTLLRCFPLADRDVIDPQEAIRQTLDYRDGSGATWRNKFDRFIEYLATQCSTEERRLYLDAAARTQTGGIRIEGEEESAGSATVTLPNVQVATGTTRRDSRSRLMHAFNTPFFPEILVCSEVMGEGVDLQRFCRHVIHHDLAWNPSSIEQRTGRIDRLGCAAEGRHPIVVYLPYLAGTADERQYRVMSEREQWFRVVMGQEEVARLVTTESNAATTLPTTISEELSFRLDGTSRAPRPSPAA